MSEIYADTIPNPLSGRSSGLLLHVTSLPSRYGIGAMGAAAYQLADRLAEAGLKYWQILPLNPSNPYSGDHPISAVPPLPATRC